MEGRANSESSSEAQPWSGGAVVTPCAHGSPGQPEQRLDNLRQKALLRGVATAESLCICAMIPPQRLRGPLLSRASWLMIGETVRDDRYRKETSMFTPPPAHRWIGGLALVLVGLLGVLGFTPNTRAADDYN